MASKIAGSNPQRQPSTSRSCLCSPTKHPGSFRCSLHRNSQKAITHHQLSSNSTTKWELAVIAKANSIKAFLLQVIKPSSHDLHRRRNFQPKPSRFCLMNNNRGVAVS